jgi:hypothetical protein
MPKSIEDADVPMVPHTLIVDEQGAEAPAQFCDVKVQLCVAVGDVVAEPLAPLKFPLPRLPVQEYGSCPSASLVEVHESVDVCPDVVIVVGENDSVQLGAPHTVTEAVQVFVAFNELATVRVQLWLAVGDFTELPVAPDAVPLPRFPVHVYGAELFESFVNVHDNVDVPPLVIEAGLNDAVHVAAGTTVTEAAQVAVEPAAF